MGKKQGAPPSDQARLEMFVSLVDEYEELTRAFPVEQRSFTFGGRPRDPSDRWHRLVRAFALRKFVMAQGDHVHVYKILDVLRQLAPEHAAAVQAIRDALPGLVNGGGVFIGRDGTELRAEDIIRDSLYGSYLHGDYDKWRRSRERHGLAEEHALWTWTSGAEDYVRRIANLARQAKHQAGGE